MLKKLKRLLLSRVFIVGLLIALQFAVILVTVIEFSRYFVYYYFVTYILGIVYMLRIIYQERNMAYKLAWIVVILLFPPFGIAVYEILCGNKLSKSAQRKIRSVNKANESVFGEQELHFRIREKNPEIWRQAEYIKNTTRFPPYMNRESVYYPSGECMYGDFLQELEGAEKYIFLEYFIIEDGEMWQGIYDILRKKADAGVDVRVIYDDVGCITRLSGNFSQKLEKDGIRCRVFHRFIPVLSSRQNNRDHRKICVIDGKTAFTGGINIADEYINKNSRLGYWKDNAVKIKGEGAWSFAVMFLSMWDYLSAASEEQCSDYAKFKPHFSDEIPYTEGIVQPYTDSPLDNESIGENVYLNIIAAARDYVWITTPYLIIDEQMEKTLCTAAKSGIDVRIVLPGIPDKKIIRETGESYCRNLMESGVKIYEYTPGFLHGKTFLCDGKYAVVGSVNLDYRSLYLHFECGVWMCGCECISDIRKDFEEILSVSSEASQKKNSLIGRLFRGVLELLSPLL